ncbi:MAG TPA: exodeoxyribonuclease VII large subunit [Gammaproteobacteria bacterium]|nr:exodeoxyribonuclease VII large subunit [Gammaproteobacteria bacterium]
MNDLFARRIYSVSELSGAARLLLENAFPSIWVQGEVSNLARPASGHCYFTLKDDAAQIRCALFRQRGRAPAFVPANGALVVVRARVSIYAQRGDFQLICEAIEPAGEGALRQAFEALKQKLAAEGLFDAALKRPLPPLPRCIAVVTSPTGAAIRDILTTLKRRFPCASVRIYPAAVQGVGAAAEIVAAIKRASADNACDVLILARGGGSLEDLQSFNDETVARAIRASALPVIVGVGHEIDFTIADFAADLRAPTPTAAAEHAAPDCRELGQIVAHRRAQLERELRALLNGCREDAERAIRRLEQLHPRARLRDQAQRLDELDTRLRQALAGRLEMRRQHLRRAVAELREQAPWRRLQMLNEQLAGLRERLRFAGAQPVHTARNRYALAARALDAVSPLATLGRGYAIVTGDDGRAITDAARVRGGDNIRARLARGELQATVTTTRTED